MSTKIGSQLRKMKNTCVLMEISVLREHSGVIQ